MTEKDFSNELLSLITKKKENNDKEYHTLIEEIDGICHCFVNKVLRRSWFINPILKEGKNIAEAIDKKEILLYDENKDDILLDLENSTIIFTTTLDRKFYIILTYRYIQHSNTYHIDVCVDDNAIRGTIYCIKLREDGNNSNHSSFLSFKTNPSKEYIQGLLKLLRENQDKMISLIDMIDIDETASLVKLIKDYLK